MRTYVLTKCKVISNCSLDDVLYWLFFYKLIHVLYCKPVFYIRRYSVLTMWTWHILFSWNWKKSKFKGCWECNSQIIHWCNVKQILLYLSEKVIWKTHNSCNTCGAKMIVMWQNAWKIRKTSLTLLHC